MTWKHDFFSKSRYLLVAVSAILLLNLFVAVFLGYRTSRRLYRNSLLEYDLPLLRDSLYTEILAELSPPLTISEYMSKDVFLRSWINNGETNVSQITEHLGLLSETLDVMTAFSSYRNDREPITTQTGLSDQRR